MGEVNGGKGIRTRVYNNGWKCTNELIVPMNMRAAVINKYGEPEELHTETIPVPEVGDWEVLVQVEMAE